MRRLFVSAFALVVVAGCFDLERHVSVAPGTITGRAVRRDDDDKPARFSRVVSANTGLTRRAGDDGAFTLLGLAAGDWALRFVDDGDGDGRAEREALRAVRITTTTTQAGATPNAVLLGDVPLDGTFQLDGTVVVSGIAGVPDGPPPATVVAKVFAVRSLDVLDPAVVDASAVATLLLGVELEASVDAAGRFRFPAVGSGDVQLVGTLFARNADGTLGALVGFAPPQKVSGKAGSNVDLSATPLPVAFDAAAAGATRTVQIAFAPPPSGTLAIRFVGVDGNVAASFDVDGGANVSVEAPVGVFTLEASDADGRFGTLSQQLLLPEAVDVAKGPPQWGPLLLSDQGVCGPAGNDCDGDDVPGLPALEVLPDGSFSGQLDLWAACTSTCTASFGESGGDATCDAPGGPFDCDDDGDGQPDVTENPRCYGPGRGTDLDSDDLCEPGEDPFPNCRENDPANPACAADAAGPGRPGAFDFGADVDGQCLGGGAPGTSSAQILVARDDGAVSSFTCDVDGDGLDDAIFVSAEGGVSIYAGNADGDFTTPSNVAIGGAAAAGSCGDVDNNGAIDIAVGREASGDIVLLLAGEGFVPQVLDVALASPSTTALLDSDGDGNLDLVVRTGATWQVLRGLGSGSFSAPAPLFGVSGTLVFGDVDGDGRAEIIETGVEPLVVHSFGAEGLLEPLGTISLTGCGRASIVDPTIGDGITTLAPPNAVDVDRDGLIDLVTTCDLVVTTFHNEGGLVFAPCGLGTAPAACGPEGVANCFDQDTRGSVSVLDFNGDGHVDFTRAEGAHILALGQSNAGGGGEGEGEGPAPACVNNAQCPAGQVCDPSGVCVGGGGGGGGGGFCGDGITTSPEQCDDGNAVDDDGCSNTCTLSTAGGCNTDTDCGAGFVCLSTVCTPTIAPCGAAELSGPTAATTGFIDGAQPSASSGTCGGGQGVEKFFVWTAPAGGSVTVDTAGSAVDTVLYVRDGSCGAASAELGCNDDFGDFLTSFVTFTAVAGATYTIVVDTFGGTGSFQLQLALTLVP